MAEAISIHPQKMRLPRRYAHPNELMVWGGMGKSSCPWLPGVNGKKTRAIGIAHATQFFVNIMASGGSGCFQETFI
ncbi:MAG: hypothetical protein WC975_00215 [Phycisphaerae bacterium]